MAWIEAHQELADHPKTFRMSRALDVPRTSVIGHMMCLWWWSLSYADDGDLTAYSEHEVALGARWDGDPVAFVDALVAAGFVDVVPDPDDPQRDMTILHDWDDYAGKLVARRRADAERKRTARATPPPKPRRGRPAPVRRTSSVREENTTEHNTTEPDSPVDETPTEPGAAIVPTTTIERGTDYVWEGFATRFGRPTNKAAAARRGRNVRDVTEAIANERHAGDRTAARFDPTSATDVIDRSERWPLHFDGATLTEEALAKHWDTLGREPLRAARATVARVNDEQDRQRRRAEAAAMEADMARRISG